MRFGIELTFTNVGNPKMAARLTGGPMIQATAENKYSFNMQVSVKAMAALGRDRQYQKVAEAQQFLTSRFSPLGWAATTRPCENGRRNLTGSGSKWLSFTNPLWLPAIRRFSSQAALATGLRPDTAAPIGPRYSRIFNPYLCRTRLSASGASRGKRLDCLSTNGLRSCCGFYF
jgi:hypothetical protein